MKKIINFAMALMMAVLAIICPTTAVVSAANNKSNWITNNNSEYYYDLNKDGTLNVFDFILVKKAVLEDGTLSLLDLINLRCYLQTGELHTPITFSEWDMPVADTERDYVIAKAAHSKIVAYCFEFGAVRLLFLNNAEVVELRFEEFGSPIMEVDKKMLEIPNVCTIYKREATNTYFVSTEFILNNAVLVNENQMFPTEKANDILTVTENSDESISIYLKDTENIVEYKYTNTTNVVDVLWVANMYGKKYIFGYDTNKQYVRYTGEYTLDKDDSVVLPIA